MTWMLFFVHILLARSCTRKHIPSTGYRVVICTAVVMLYASRCWGMLCVSTCHTDEVLMFKFFFIWKSNISMFVFMVQC